MFLTLIERAFFFAQKTAGHPLNVTVDCWKVTDDIADLGIEAQSIFSCTLGFFLLSGAVEFLGFSNLETGIADNRFQLIWCKISLGSYFDELIKFFLTFMKEKSITNLGSVCYGFGESIIWSITPRITFLQGKKVEIW